ncbi:MAG: NAD(P)/FAD-dependent oxidoreductase [Thermoplasmata archaeon]|nr:NAD(P)/FAD-dependent oxidoreductase [Thermoplasmata archaeon]
MESVEVLVVGAGPAGSTVAHELALQGREVLVVEEHGRVGRPVQCAGLVSRRVLDLADAPSIVRTSVHGASVFGPDLNSISFKAPEPRAFVIDREGLDVHLADRAARAGARFETGTKFEGRTSSGADGSVVRLSDGGTQRREVRARLVVGADGVASAVARAYRLRRPVEVLPAFEAEFPQSPGDADQVEVYLGREFAPGLFGWWIPDGFGGARVGIACSAGAVTARQYFERLLTHLEKRFGERLRNPTSLLVSGIPIGVLPRTHADGVLLVGDAAAQVKPLSGGGIFTGMRCAQLAAATAQRALAADDVSAASLAPYDAAWRAELGDEFAKTLYLRKLFLRLSDTDLNRIVTALKEGGMADAIVAFGDIDFPSHVARRLLRQSPSLFRLFPRALGALVSGPPERAPELEPGPLREAK